MTRTTWVRSAMLAGLLAIFLPVWAHSESALDPSLEEAVANDKKTSDEAQKYTYTEHKKDLTFDSKGRVKQDSSDTFEIIFLEGAPYQKHTLHNGKPLPEKEQKAEDKKLADVAKARRENPEKDRVLSGQFHLKLPVDQIAAHFDVSAAGSDEIDGRKTLVFNAVPRPGSGGMKEMSRDGLAWEMKLWVDEQDKVFSKIDAKVIADGMRYENGLVCEFNWQRVNGEAWLPVRYWIKGKVRYMMMNVPVETEQSYSDYKKFHADTKIVAQ
ncbi:MAG: hypothetical protein WBS24_10910 [Terriglobales bacterium]